MTEMTISYLASNGDAAEKKLLIPPTDDSFDDFIYALKKLKSNKFTSKTFITPSVKEKPPMILRAFYARLAKKAWLKSAIL